MLLLGAVGFLIWPPEGVTGQQFKAACWRLGPALAVLWLAYSEVERLPPWLLFAVPVLLALLAWRPKLLLVAIPILIALAILKPRIARRQ